jgi:hypothetical protein
MLICVYDGYGGRRTLLVLARCSHVMAAPNVNAAQTIVSKLVSLVCSVSLYQVYKIVHP